MVTFFKKNLLVWVLLVLTIPTFASLIRPGYFPMQDDLQAFRIHQMFECFKDFQLPCRWVPDAGYQYGYPQFNYYPPSVYYLGGFLHLIGFQYIDSVKILFAIGMITAALFMFIFLKSFLGELPAFVGAVLYTYIPYRAVEVYVRGAMSEFFSLSIFPLIFWSIYQLIQTSKKKYFVFLGISVGLLLITHNLMTIIFIPLAAIWSLVLLVLKKDWKIFPKLLLSGLLGLGLAAFFTLPVLFERQYGHLESLLGGYFDWRQHFVSFEQLLISNHFGYGSSFLGPGDDLSLTTGPLHAFLAGLAVFFALVSFKKEKKIAILTLVLAFVEVLVLFMMHQKSSFIWERLEFLHFLQFPWRFLADSIFLVSILGATLVYFVNKIKYGFFLGAFIVVSVILLNVGFFKPSDWLNITDQDKFSGQFWEKQLTISIFDYLPIYAKLPPIKKAPDYPEVMDGEAKFINYQKGSDYQSGEVVVTENANFRLPLFDYPGMTVYVDNNKISHWHDDCRNQEFCLGLISFDLEVGKHTIKAQLEDTPIRTLGNSLSLISLLIILGLIFKKKPNFNL